MEENKTHIDEEIKNEIKKEEEVILKTEENANVENMDIVDDNDKAEKEKSNIIKQDEENKDNDNNEDQEEKLLKKRSREEDRLESIFMDPGLAVHLSGVPQYLNKDKLWKELKSIGVDCSNVKRVQRVNFAIIVFEDQEKKRDGIEKILEKGIKGSKDIKIQIQNKKQKIERSDKNTNKSVMKKDIRDVVSPYWNIPYEEQLSLKKKELIKNLVKATKSIKRESKYNIPDWVNTYTMKNKLCCQLDPVIIPSPQIDFYRNKVSYTIGKDINKNPMVGFTLGRYADNVTAIGNPEECPHISKIAEDIRNIFQEEIINFKLEPYDKVTKGGYLRELAIKTFTTNEILITLQVFSKELKTEEETNNFNEFKRKVIERLDDYKNNINTDIKVISLNLQYHSGVSNAAESDDTIENIYNDVPIHEKIFDLTFQVSSNAFFQVNTKAAEVLYKTIGEWAGIIPEDNDNNNNENESNDDQNNKVNTILDICCGTGTIGLYLSKYVDKVIGIDIEPQAIIDAKRNADLNNITNVEYITGPAERNMDEILSKVEGNCIGIVDPPRAGLHTNVIKALRECESMKKFIYVSCNQKSLVANTAHLCRSTSRSMRGVPFRPTRCAGIDLFPHTPNCEALMIFERADQLPHLLKQDQELLEQILERRRQKKENRLKYMNNKNNTSNN